MTERLCGGSVEEGHPEMKLLFYMFSGYGKNIARRNVIYNFETWHFSVQLKFATTISVLYGEKESEW